MIKTDTLIYDLYFIQMDKWKHTVFELTLMKYPYKSFLGTMKVTSMLMKKINVPVQHMRSLQLFYQTIRDEIEIIL